MLFNKSSNKRLSNGMQGKQLYRQQGFVLILALVMLTVLTLIGVSSMNSANMELRATANAQQHQVAFNAVSSALEFAVSGDSTLDFAPADLIATQVAAYTLPDSSTSGLSFSMTYAGCNVGVGSSLAGKGFSYNFFNIAGSGGNADSATSLQTQGVRFPSASCDPTLIP